VTPAALAVAIVAALLAAFPHWPARGERARATAEARVAVILAACDREGASRAECIATASECYVESGLRMRHPGSSLCGCQPYGTDDATQARCAVRSVMRARRECGVPDAASTRYIDGRCVLPRWVSPRWRGLVAAHVAQARRVRAALAAAIGDTTCAR
jgi:hypothetical protein